MGGGNVSLPNPKLQPELNQIYKGLNTQTLPAFQNFVSGQPLLSNAQSGALDFWNQLPGLIAPEQNQLSALPQEFGTLQNQIFNLRSPLQSTYNELQPILQSQGALTLEQESDVDQATRAGEAARGMATTTPGLGQELLNRDLYRQQRFGTALTQEEGLSTSLSGLTGQQAGLIGQNVGLTSGLTSGIQGLQSGGLNQLLGTEQGETGAFSALTNPLYGLFEAAQGNSLQAQIANQNKGAGLAGGGISAIGEIAPLLMMLA